MLNFWEIAGLILSITQMGFYLASVDKYKDKLEDYSDQLELWGDEDKLEYKKFRDLDPDFYAYYESLDLYTECESNIKRSKGKAWFGYGSKVRRRLQTNRGFTPLAKVHFNNMLASEAVAESATTRAATCVKERQRTDGHLLERWSSIVSAPVGVERYQASIASGIISQSFKSLKGAGQGFNSAASSFGTQLYRVLN